MISIVEFPFSGVITRKIETTDANGDTTEVTITIYSGVLDSGMQTAEIGQVGQTSNYIVCMPLVKGTDGLNIVPKKSDEIQVATFDDSYKLVVNNTQVSQLGKVMIYASRGEW